MQVKLLKLLPLIVLKCTVDHGQQHIVNDIQHNDKKGNKKQWCQWLCFVGFHHDIRKTV